MTKLYHHMGNPGQWPMLLTWMVKCCNADDLPYWEGKNWGRGKGREGKRRRNARDLLRIRPATSCCCCCCLEQAASHFLSLPTESSLKETRSLFLFYAALQIKKTQLKTNKSFHSPGFTKSFNHTRKGGKPPHKHTMLLCPQIMYRHTSCKGQVVTNYSIKRLVLQSLILPPLTLLYWPLCQFHLLKCES